MVSETVEQAVQEGAATAETQAEPTIPAAAESQAPAATETAAPPAEPQPSEADKRLAELEKQVSRLDKENRGKDRFISSMAGAASVQEAVDRVDLKEARDADKEEGRDPNAQDSATAKVRTAIEQRKAQEAVSDDLDELSEPLTVMGTERNAQGAFVTKTPEELEVARVWGDGSNPKARRAAIRLANKYAREKAATMTTTQTTPKPASTNGAAAAAPAKTFTEAELKAEREKAAKDAVDQARKEWLKGGALETTPSTARGGDNKQELVNRFARGESMSDDEIKEASNAMDNGVLPKRRP